jgi:hypothetical protein
VQEQDQDDQTVAPPRMSEPHSAAPHSLCPMVHRSMQALRPQQPVHSCRLDYRSMQWPPYRRLIRPCRPAYRTIQSSLLHRLIGLCRPSYRSMQWLPLPPAAPDVTVRLWEPDSLPRAFAASDPAQAVRPQTRLQNNIIKVKDFCSDILCYDPSKRGFIAHVVSSMLAQSEPISHSDALRSPCWQQAMQEEFDTLIKNDTWKFVPSKPGRNLVDCKWTFKIKRHADGSIDHYNARLVAKGFN